MSSKLVAETRGGELVGQLPDTCYFHIWMFYGARLRIPENSFLHQVSIKLWRMYRCVVPNFTAKLSGTWEHKWQSAVWSCKVQERKLGSNGAQLTFYFLWPPYHRLPGDFFIPWRVDPQWIKKVGCKFTWNKTQKLPNRG